MAKPTIIPTYEILPEGVQSIPATGKHRLVVATSGALYQFGFGATQPTVWSPHAVTINDGFNAPDEMGTMWIYNPNSVTLNINVHVGA